MPVQWHGTFGPYLLFVEEDMGTSRDELVAQIMALSLKKHMGMDVSEEVKRIISLSQTEVDKQHLLRLCRGLGLN
jgi:hypothetical protein